MDYTEVKITIHLSEAQKGILISKLSDIGYEGFIEDDDSLTAYIPGKDFERDPLLKLLDSYLPIESNQSTVINTPDSRLPTPDSRLVISNIPDQNWNALWESNFEPVIIADQCYVRAPFHEKRPEIPLEIVIEPKMSFGTAHHETTALMMELILSLDMKNKSVLDMGCGTAILAILASIRGAGKIIAIDNDEWAYRNSLENINTNNTPGIEIIMGDAGSIPKHKFDIIIANINRNILMQDIPDYANHLVPGGLLLLSGFYQKDMEAIRSQAEKQFLHFNRYLTRNDWVAMVLNS